MSYLRLVAIGMAVVFVSSCAAKAPSPALCTAIGVALGGAGGVAAGDGQGPGDDDEAKVGYGVGGALVGGLIGYGICSYFAEEPAPAPPPPAPKPMAGPDPCAGAVRLYGINFEVNKAMIRPESFKILDQLVTALKKCPAKVIKIEGHTDSTGSDAYNMSLSDRRAASVKDYLVQHGIAASALETQGFGESRPIASNDTAEGRAQNRRVEMKPIR